MAKVKYSKEEFYNEILRLYNEYGRIDINVYKEHTRLSVGFNTYCNKYGGLKQICKDLGIKYFYYNEKTKEWLLQKGSEILKENGKINKEICEKNGIHGCSIVKQFGSFCNFFKELGYDNNFHRNVSFEDLQKDIKDFWGKYESNSYTLYKKYGTYSQCVVDRYGGWVVVLEKIGLKPILKRPGKEKIIEETQRLINKYGFLSVELIKQNCSFTLQALEFHLGNAEDICKYFNNPNLFDTKRNSMEILIEQLLIEIIGKDSFRREYTWTWLLSDIGTHLYVDFYIPDINTVIEYDGEQHYKFTKFFYKTQEQFKRRQMLDKLKERLLLEHNVKVFHIPYYQKIDKQLIENICKQN